MAVMKIGLVTLVLLACIFIDMTWAIKCYGCDVDTCRNFDESAAFEIECKHSTMCLKKIYPYLLTTGEQIKSYWRGCANQEEKTMVLNGTVWVDKIRIIQLSEGCGRLKKNSDIVFCHCHGDRCNGARPQSDEATASKTVEEIYATNESTTTTSHSCSTDAMAVIFMFNALKYWRSIAD